MNKINDKLITFFAQNMKFFIKDFLSKCNYIRSFQLRLFMMSFKYGLLLLRYSSTDSVLFLSELLLYSAIMLLQKVFILTGL